MKPLFFGSVLLVIAVSAAQAQSQYRPYSQYSASPKNYHGFSPSSSPYQYHGFTPSSSPYQYHGFSGTPPTMHFDENGGYYGTRSSGRSRKAPSYSQPFDGAGTYVPAHETLPSETPSGYSMPKWVDGKTDKHGNYVEGHMVDEKYHPSKETPSRWVPEHWKPSK